MRTAGVSAGGGVVACNVAGARWFCPAISRFAAESSTIKMFSPGLLTYDLVRTKLLNSGSIASSSRSSASQACPA